MRANEIEIKLVSLILKAKVFKRRRCKGFIGLTEMMDLLEKSLFDPSVDSPDVRKIMELIVQMCKCPDAKVGWREFVQKYRDVILSLSGPD